MVPLDMEKLARVVRHYHAFRQRRLRRREPRVTVFLALPTLGTVALGLYGVAHGSFDLVRTSVWMMIALTLALWVCDRWCGGKKKRAVPASAYTVRTLREISLGCAFSHTGDGVRLIHELLEATDHRDPDRADALLTILLNSPAFARCQFLRQFHVDVRAFVGSFPTFPSRPLPSP